MPGHRIWVSAIENVPAERDDAIALAGPRPIGERAHLPLDAEMRPAVPGGREIGVGRVERDLRDEVAQHVRRGKVAAELSVHFVDGAVHGDGR